MAKTPPKKKSSKARLPEPAQIKGVERLIESRDYPKAIERARSLVERYPDHGGAWRLLVDARALGDGHAAAALAAYQWAARRPNSALALDTLLRLAVDRGHLVLADHTAARVRGLGTATPGFPLAPETRAELMLQPDGSQATSEELERFDIGKLHLEAHDFAGAVRALHGVAITPARNNCALALFHLDRIEESLNAFMDAWQADPGNLFGLGWALRLRLYRGDEIGARGLAVPLAQAEARRLEDAQAQVLTLLFMREDQAAWDAFERSERADWAGRDVGPLAAAWRHLGACAASRLGRRDQARTLWRQAKALHAGLDAADVNLAAMARDAAPPAFPELLDRGQALPFAWIEDLRAGGTAGLDARVDRLSASDAYLEAISLAGDQAVRGLASLLLKRRLKTQAEGGRAEGQRGAADILRDLARLPIGDAQERLGFLSALRERGLIAADEVVRYWKDGALQEVKLVSTEIHREPEPSDLPEDLQARMEEFILLYREGRIDEAEAALNAVLERVPDHRVALGNLAGIRAHQGRLEETRDILRRVIELYPDYLMARCNLADLLIEDGALDEAKGLLDGLAQRPRMHAQDVFALYGVLAMLSRATGDEKAADGLIASLESIVEDEHDEDLLAVAKARVARLTPAGRFEAILRKMLKTPPRPYKPKRR
jgi:tetratricopeptide (TPR) repeat protein